MIGYRSTLFRSASSLGKRLACSLSPDQQKAAVTSNRKPKFVIDDHTTKLPLVEEWPTDLIYNRTRPVEEWLDPNSTDPLDRSLIEEDFFGVNQLFTIEDMFNARCHFGHKVGSLTENMEKFIFGERCGVCIFDLDISAAYLRRALNFLAHVAYRGGIVLFITTDPKSVHMVEKTAKECGEYSQCHRWRKGTFTNAEHLFKCTIRYPDVVVMTSTASQLTPHLVIREAAKLMVTTVAVVDTNCDPNLITYPIPGNDDSLASVEFYLKMFKAAVSLGKRRRVEDFGAGDDERYSPEKLKEMLDKGSLVRDATTDALVGAAVEDDVDTPDDYGEEIEDEKV